MYLALRVSSPGFPQAFRVLRYSGTVTRKMCSFRLKDYYPLGFCFPADSAKNAFCNFLLVKDRRYRPTTPRRASTLRFGLIPFRSPLLREYNLFIFLLVLRCFTSQGTLPAPTLPSLSSCFRYFLIVLSIIANIMLAD